MKRELTLCRLSVWAATAVILGATLPPTALAQGRSDEALAALDWAQQVPGEILVQFRAGASRAEKTAARRRARGERLETVVPKARREEGAGDLELVRIPPGIGISEAVRQVEGDPAVEFAEPNWVYQHDTFSSGTTVNAIKAVDYIIDLTDQVSLRATTLGTLAIPAAPFVP